MSQSLNMSTKELGCPHCHSPLSFETLAAECVSCGRVYPIEEGVLCTDRSDTFMGEFDAEKMSQFAQEARNIGWRRVVQEQMLDEDPKAQTILLSPDRASFVDLFETNTKASILDLGAGMGAISQQLAKSFSKVYALDLAFERLAFLQVVAEQEKADGINAVCHRDVCNLPFQSNSLDAAVMIGVFEYFPLSYPKNSFAYVQSRALSELHRVISANGELLIATKNRFGWPYWMGAKDSSHLPFGSLLPRWMADIASRILLRQPYRIITDSYHGYTSLLKEAGFEEIRFYWPVEGYQKSRAWIDLSDNDAVKTAIKNEFTGSIKKTALLTLANLGIFKYFVPHFGIIARKPI